MRRLLLSVLAVAVTATTLAPSPSTAATTRRETKLYTVGAAGEALYALCDAAIPEAPAPTVGGACFTMQPGDTTLSLSITDNNSLVEGVNADVAFINASGLVAGRHDYCNADATFPIPASAVFVRVTLYGELLNLFGDCDPIFPPPTEGVIAASITGAAPPPGRAESRTFVAGSSTSGTTVIVCASQTAPGAPDIGGACFAPLPGESKVSVQAQWINTVRPFTLRFLNASGTVIGSSVHCDQSPVVTMPAGTVLVQAAASVLLFGYPCDDGDIVPVVEPVQGAFVARFP